MKDKMQAQDIQVVAQQTQDMQYGKDMLSIVTILTLLILAFLLIVYLLMRKKKMVNQNEMIYSETDKSSEVKE